MKKLILFLMLLTVPIIAQSQGLLYGGGVILTDSLYYGTPGDSVNIYDLRFNQMWMSIIIEGNSNSPVDSIAVRKGSLVFNDAGVAIDTVWGNQIDWKDSTWTDVNTLVNNSTGVHYTAFEPIVQFIKLEILNARANLPTRKLQYTLQYMPRK